MLDYLVTRNLILGSILNSRGTNSLLLNYVTTPTSSAHSNRVRFSDVISSCRFSVYKVNNVPPKYWTMILWLPILCIFVPQSKVFPSSFSPFSRAGPSKLRRRSWSKYDQARSLGLLLSYASANWKCTAKIKERNKFPLFWYVNCRTKSRFNLVKWLFKTATSSSFCLFPVI